jgi:hypothetical protein
MICGPDRPCGPIARAKHRSLPPACVSAALSTSPVRPMLAGLAQPRSTMWPAIGSRTAAPIPGRAIADDTPSAAKQVPTDTAIAAARTSFFMCIHPPEVK